MKKAIFVLLVFATMSSQAQSLKDALFSGKLKSDSGSVVRKTDDLSKKIDTSRKVPPVAEKTKPGLVVTDKPVSNPVVPAGTGRTDTTNAATATEPATAPKDNNKTWKEFVDATIRTLQDEVMTSKKIKKGDYVVMVDYVIEPDGKVTIGNVYPNPENKFLEEQVKERLGIDTPQLNPVLGSNGKGRKVNKRYNFTITKN